MFKSEACPQYCITKEQEISVLGERFYRPHAKGEEENYQSRNGEGKSSFALQTAES